jgi:hypothetical protein
MRGSALRLSALVSAGVLAVHELRFLLAPASHPEEDGHAYLAFVAPLIGLLLAVVAAQFAVRFSRRLPPAWRPARRPVGLWLLIFLTLVAVYAAQELGEGLLAPAHPSGLAGVFGHGGWMAVGLALIVSAGIVALVRGAEQLLVRRAGRALHRPLLPPPGAWALRAARTPRLQPLARHLAGRAPPLLP